jgi:hypothetical protein
MSIPEQNIQAQPEQKAADLDKNFATQRRYYEKQLDAERQARTEMEARLAQIEQRAPSQENDHDDDNEPYVDKKTLKKQFGAWEKSIDQKIEQKAEQKSRQLIEQERQNSFLKHNPDFSQVLTPDLVAKFAETHPDIAEPMLEMPDNFARQKLLYQNIKALGLHKPPAPKEDIQAKIDANRRSPYYQPSGMAGAPPYAQNGDFSQSGQKNAYDKMKQLIANRRG